MKNLGGRPTDYKPSYCSQANKLSLLGLTDPQIAAHFGVSERTLNLWKTTYPKFSQAIKDGKGIADGKVVKSLYQKAIGGDTTAMIFWLKNRQRANWREKHEIDHTTLGKALPTPIYGGKSTK